MCLLCVRVVAGIRRQRRPVSAVKSRSLSPQRDSSLAPIDDRFDGIGGVAVCFTAVGYNVQVAGSQPSTLPLDTGSESPRGMRRVLQGASGLVRAGEMCAVMGPSGEK